MKRCQLNFFLGSTSEDVDRVCVALRLLLTDDDLRRRMGATARYAVETHYNWDRVARDTLEFVDEVTRGGVRMSW